MTWDRVRVACATTGTGTLTLGAAQTGFRSFVDANVPNGSIVTYAIEDGTAWEVGQGTYTVTGSLLTRVVQTSSSSNTAINLSGNSRVFITLSAQDITELASRVQTVNGLAPDGSGNVVISPVVGEPSLFTATGNGAITTYALGRSDLTANLVMVFLNGIRQQPTADYTVSGSNLIFSVSVPTGYIIEAILNAQFTLGPDSLTTVINNSVTVSTAPLVATVATKITVEDLWFFGD
jgi:hypothetical protein